MPEYYTDPTPIDIENWVDMNKVDELHKKLANWIRVKMNGIDVREALARLVEQTSSDLFDANEVAIALEKLAYDLEEEWKNTLAGLTVDSELINARIDIRGFVYKTLKERLDSMQTAIDKLNPVANIFSIEHNQFGYPAVRVLALNYGLGVVPLESEPVFGGSTTVSVNCDVEYLDRNSLTVKVPLAYAMTNPTIERISANEYLLVEGINSLVVVVGNVVEANVETFVTKTLKSDFTGKIAGSDLENANNLKWIHRNSIQAPSVNWSAATQVYINMVYKLDNVAFVATAIANSGGLIPQVLIEFNILRILEQNFPQVFNSAKTVAGKVAIAKERIVAIKPLAFAKGVGPSGNKASAQVYVANEWVGTSTNTTNTINEIGFNQVNPVVAPRYVHSDGNCYLIVYGQASNETVQSSVSIDYTSIELIAKVPFSKY